MEAIDFTLDGDRHILTADIVRSALRGQVPGRIQTYAVDVDGTLFPVKQAIASALRIPKSRFISTRAVELLRKVGMRVVEVGEDAAREAADAAGRPQEGPATVVAVRAREAGLRHAVGFVVGRGIAARPEEVLEIAAVFAKWIAGPPPHSRAASIPDRPDRS